MNRTIKMAMTDRLKHDESRDPESRFRDRDGREHYNNGRYAPMNYNGMWVDGRHNEGRNNQDYGEMRYPFTPFVPPVYRVDDYMEGQNPQNKIGFSVHGEAQNISEFDQYHQNAGYQPMNELERHSRKIRVLGNSERNPGKLTREMAESWTSNMENSDGTTGPHWTFDQTKQVMDQKGYDFDPIEFWVALNAVYSDMALVNKKHNVNTIDFYVDTAIAFWLKDKDAVKNKLAAYYEYVVKH